MAITINTNVASLRGQRFLTNTSDKLANTYGRLSSGQRVNKASDDAAGLAIADSLRNNQRIASVAIRNAQEGISSVSLASGALEQVGDFLQRLSELATQAANGTYSSQQRDVMQLEFTALSSEIERIAQTTQFNGVALLSGSSQLTLQIGFDSTAGARLQITQPTATLQGLGLGNGTSILYSITGSGDAGISAARAALDGISGALQSMSVMRGTLGSAESRLLSAVNGLQIARENLAAAESRIRDVDVASEASELTRLTILQQAGAAVLAQANQQPQLALQLLR